MPKFEQYDILLKNFAPGAVQVVEYVLDDDFFRKIDSPAVQKGRVEASVRVSSRVDAFELQFALDGCVSLPCDRCLDEMDLPIAHRESLRVKLGERFSEEGDTVVVPEREGVVNVAWFLYEFVVLNIPLKHVHEDGQCNKAMLSKLQEHIARSDNDDPDNDLDGDSEERGESL